MCCYVKNLKPLRKTVNLLGRNSARRASELRKHTGRASFSYTNFVLKTHGIQEEMWKEIQAFWREKKVYDKFTQLRRQHFRHFLSFFDKSLAHWELRKLDLIARYKITLVARTQNSTAACKYKLLKFFQNTLWKCEKVL